MPIHNKFNELSTKEKAFISNALNHMFDIRAQYGIQFLDGADPCERVAEAMAVWIITSKPKDETKTLAALILPGQTVEDVLSFEAMTGKCFNCRTKGHLLRDHADPQHTVNQPPDTFEQWRVKQ